MAEAREAVILTPRLAYCSTTALSPGSTRAAPTMELVDMPYGPQVLWPIIACRGHTVPRFMRVLSRPCRPDYPQGVSRQIYSYSAFFENDQTLPQAGSYLRSRGLTELEFVALPPISAVAWFGVWMRSKLGFKVRVLTSLCRGIDLNGSMARALDDMRAAA